MARHVVMGLDILPGESPSRSTTKYAVTILVNDKVKERINEVEKLGLLKLIDEYEVDIVAVDNIYELGEDTGEIAAFMSRSFKTPKLVQVNIINGKEYELEALARSLGLHDGGKIDPLKTSEIVAKLASMGVGSEAIIFENETRITVTRGRSLTQGGMSRERYRRNIDSLILRKTREIKEVLDKNKIDYDLYYRKSPHGYSGSIFIVYAPRRSLFGLIKPRKGHDVHVTIEPVVRDKVEFVPLFRRRKIRKAKQDRYLIVGVDPGISTGLAILTIDGYPLLLMSKRWLSRNQILKILSEYGKTLIVATDSNPPPMFAKKLATALNASLYVPKNSLSVNEKREAVARFLENLKIQTCIRVSDSHQRDALAAALKAYYSIENKLRQVDSIVRSLDIGIPVLEVKALVIKGLTINEAIKKTLSSKMAVSESLLTPPPERDLKSRIDALEAIIAQKDLLIHEYEVQIDRLEKKIFELQEEIEEFERTISLFLSAERKTIKLSKEVKSLENRVTYLSEELEKRDRLIKELKEEIIKWKRITELALENEIEKLLVIDVLTLSGVSKAIDDYGSLRDKIVYIRDATPGDLKAAEILIKEGVKAVIIRGYIPGHVKDKFEYFLIPVVKDNEIEVIEIDNNIYSEKGIIQIIENRRKELNEKWHMDFAKELEKIIKNYRYERRRRISDVVSK
ncbi:MAG: hypothetical protein DRJ38_04980 [Thermoprotei archaeon]|nr:MAG: hypothetical protein DRJ38_04980 [Thermoprotei archaeon]